MHEFGKSLNKLRKQAGLSQEELAKDVSSTKSTISKYERGVIEPTLDIAKRIANHFDVTVEYMVNPCYYSNTKTLSVAEHHEEYHTENSEYLEVIKIAKENNISASKLMELLNFTISMKNESE